MKRLIVLTAAILVTITSFSQNTFTSKFYITESKDAWGDKTGGNVLRFECIGYVSNTTEKVKLVIEANEDRNYSICFRVFDMKGNNIQTCFEHFKGTTTDSIVSISWESLESAGFTKYHFNLNWKTEFINLCSQNDTIKVSMRDGEKVLLFKIDDCKRFYSEYLRLTNK